MAIFHEVFMYACISRGFDSMHIFHEVLIECLYFTSVPQYAYIS